MNSKEPFSMCSGAPLTALQNNPTAPKSRPEMRAQLSNSELAPTRKIAPSVGDAANVNSPSRVLKRMLNPITTPETDFERADDEDVISYPFTHRTPTLGTMQRGGFLIGRDTSSEVLSPIPKTHGVKLPKLSDGRTIFSRISYPKDYQGAIRLFTTLWKAQEEGGLSTYSWYSQFCPRY